MVFRQLFDAASSTYTYLLGDTTSGEALLIDPVFEQAQRDLSLIRELGLQLKLVVDTHAHADGALLNDGQHAEGIRQGVTTEIVGPDGLTYAPLPREKYLMYRQYLSGLLGLPPEDLDMSSISSALGNYHNKTAPKHILPGPTLFLSFIAWSHALFL